MRYTLSNLVNTPSSQVYSHEIPIPEQCHGKEFQMYSPKNLKIKIRNKSLGNMLKPVCVEAT
jgi:hypothetical protein